MAERLFGPDTPLGTLEASFAAARAAGSNGVGASQEPPALFGNTSGGNIPANLSQGAPAPQQPPQQQAPAQGPPPAQAQRPSARPLFDAANALIDPRKNPLAAIGLVLQSVAAGMRGQPSPVTALQGIHAKKQTAQLQSLTAQSTLITNALTQTKDITDKTQRALAVETILADADRIIPGTAAAGVAALGSMTSEAFKLTTLFSDPIMGKTVSNYCAGQELGACARKVLTDEGLVKELRGRSDREQIPYLQDAQDVLLKAVEDEGGPYARKALDAMGGRALTFDEFFALNKSAKDLGFNAAQMDVIERNPTKFGLADPAAAAATSAQMKNATRIADLTEALANMPPSDPLRMKLQVELDSLKEQVAKTETPDRTISAQRDAQVERLIDLQREERTMRENWFTDGEPTPEQQRLLGENLLRQQASSDFLQGVGGAGATSNTDYRGIAGARVKGAADAARQEPGNLQVIEAFRFPNRDMSVQELRDLGVEGNPNDRQVSVLESATRANETFTLDGENLVRRLRDGGNLTVAASGSIIQGINAAWATVDGMWEARYLLATGKSKSVRETEGVLVFNADGTPKIGKDGQQEFKVQNIRDARLYDDALDDLGINEETLHTSAAKVAQIRSLIVSLTFTRSRSREGGRLTDQDIKESFKEMGVSADATIFANVAEEVIDRVAEEYRNSIKSVTTKRPPSTFLSDEDVSILYNARQSGAIGDDGAVSQDILNQLTPRAVDWMYRAQERGQLSLKFILGDIMGK